MRLVPPCCKLQTLVLKGDYVGIEKERPISVSERAVNRPRPTILVVDDEYFNFEMLKASLGDEFSFFNCV